MTVTVSSSIRAAAAAAAHLGDSLSDETKNIAARDNLLNERGNLRLGEVPYCEFSRRADRTAD